MSSKKIKLKMILLVIFLFALFLTSCVYWNYLKYLIRFFLEAKFLYVGIFGLSIILSLVAYFVKIEIDQDKLVFNSFGKYIDMTTSALTYATGITSSLALIKGFYIQKVFGDTQYFLIFTDFDQWLLMLTMLFLLYFCLQRMWSIFSVIFIGEETGEIS